MELGTMLPTYCTEGHRVPSDAIGEWARRAEDAELSGLWAIDHFVKPDTYRTAVLDPMVAVTHAASVTEDIGIGTSITILPRRRTANVASRALSLQHLSDGRFTLGVGAGYIPKEFEAVGVPLSERGPRLTEGLNVLQELFAGEASFEGRFHDFKDVQIDPVLEDPPRLIVGGDSNVDDDGDRYVPEPVLERILSADGWILPPSPPEKVEAEWEIVSDYLDSHGRDPSDVDRLLLNYTHLVADGDSDDVESAQRAVFEDLYSPQRGFDHARKNCLTGSIDEVIGQLDSYRELGLDEVIVGPATQNPKELDRQMDLLSNQVLSSVS
jgi:alkanesulfonate monooxygenase SsuD/methylene tetrahydromethanopterin reductase-like flavin-dependent oxidoreductase (luciferase family)